MSDVGAPSFRGLTASAYSGSGVPAFLSFTIITSDALGASFAPLTAQGQAADSIAFLPLTAVAHFIPSGASFAALTAAANDNLFAVGTPAFPPLTANASGLGEPSFAKMTAVAGDSGIGKGAASFALMTALGGESGIGRGVASFLPLNVIVSELGVPAFAKMVVVGSDAGIGSGNALFSAMGASAIEVGRPTFSPMIAMVSERGTISFAALIALADEIGDTYPGWALNYETNAPSRYMGLRANSFCQFQGVTYLATVDGIYSYGADDDAGVPIQAEIMLPKDDYGSEMNKRIPGGVWLGLRSPREMRLKVFTNNADAMYYSVDPTEDILTAVRVKLGLGVEGRYWQFGLTNLNGADFELESMAFTPIELKRHGR